ncbi:type III-D CRISPR-associated RAMP protein Csx10 [Thermoleptolyngbya sp.]
MQRIQVLITAKSPLAIARQKTGSSISDVETYISGTVLRGAIAGLMLRQAQAEGTDFANNPESDFKTLFIDNQAIFQNAYPALTEDLRISSEVRVMPATALSSKNASGFKPQKNGVFDTLIDRFCADAYGQVYDPNCPTDGDRVDPFKGFYSISKDQYSSHSASSRLLTRVGINRRRATAEDQVLYSLQVLNETKRKDDRVEDMVFAGSIWICDELAEEFCHYLERHSQHIRVGGSTSRGLGKIKVQPQLVQHQSKVKQRIDDFNAALKKRWGQWKIFGNQPNIEIQNRCFFTLDLQSDAILVEQWQRTMVISPTMLQQVVGLTSGDLQLHASYSSYSYRSGWNTAWGLPKDLELTTDRGSVYLFSIDEGDRAAWESALENLEIWGIGNAAAEGFGQAKVCDEFHNVLREEAV